MKHINTLQMHRFRYGELGAEEMDGIRQHLETCPQCAAQLRQAEATRVEFQILPIPRAIRVPPAPRWRSARLWGAVALAAAAGFAAVLTLGEPEERVKGVDLPELQAWVQADGGPRLLAPGAAVAPGASVQLRYRTERAWVGLAGREDGVVEVFGVFRAAGEGWQPTPMAFTVESGNQRFFAVYADHELSHAEVIAQVKAGAEGVEMLELRVSP